MTLSEINKTYDGVWKWIENFKGFYAVSDQGEILSLHRSKQIILKGSESGKGYLAVILSSEDNKRRCYIHRVVAETFIGKPKEGQEINHKNGDKTDNRVENLEWSTHYDNLIHAIDSGLNHTKEIRKSNGRKMKKWIAENGNPASKQVMIIGTGEVFESQSLLAEYVGLAQTTISEHCRGNIQNQKFKFVNEPNNN